MTSIAEINQHVEMCSDAQNIIRISKSLPSPSLGKISHASKSKVMATSKNNMKHVLFNCIESKKVQNASPPKETAKKETFEVVEEPIKESCKVTTPNNVKNCGRKRKPLSDDAIKEQKRQSLKCLMDGPAKRALGLIVLQYLTSDLK